MSTTPEQTQRRVEIPAVVTAEWLDFIGACRGEAEVFAAEWPEGCAPTRENLYRAAELGLALGWLAEKLLADPHLRRRYVEREAEAFDRLDHLWPDGQAERRAAYAESPAWRDYYRERAHALADALGLPGDPLRELARAAAEAYRAEAGDVVTSSTLADLVEGELLDVAEGRETPLARALRAGLDAALAAGAGRPGG